MRGTRFGRRANLLWIAAFVHRLSGLALAAFLPAHFLVLGLAINGAAKFEGFLRWTDQPIVKFAESAVVFLLVVHMLGGLRLLLVENLPWRNWQVRFVASAGGVSIVLAVVFLVRVL
jgi:fumarate reductase subunit D